MKKTTTFITIFAPLVIASMVLALPLSTDDTLDSPRSTISETVHAIVDQQALAPSVTDESNQANFPESASTVVMLLGASIIGLVAINRKKI